MRHERKKKKECFQDMDQIVIDFSRSRGVISPELYGHFSEHIGGVFYDGLWVGEDSPVDNIHGFRKALVDSFKKIAPPVLRWPGGCFAETYDWRDGIGPRKSRPTRVNWWYYHDHRMESNQVGTHEFMDLCRLVGAEPYIAANMTATTPLHIRDWIEYCNFPRDATTLTRERAANGDAEPFGVRYWGIGNENWGGGGQMSPEMCAREYIRYTTIFRSLDTSSLRLILCGANGRDLDWTRRLMKEWADRPWHEVPTWGVSFHYYTDWSHGHDELVFKDEEQWYDELFRADRMREVIDAHRLMMDEFDPQRKLKMVVDEWGNWHVEGTGPSKGCNLFEQQSNLRDAAVAALTLNIFNNRCDVVGMANLAQLVNNLHSLYLAGGGNFVETPNYHVFAMYMGHQGGRQLETNVSARTLEHERYDPLSTLSCSASVKDGSLTVTLANLDLTTAKDVRLTGLGGAVTGKGQLTILSHADPLTCNTFEQPDAVAPVTANIDFADGGSIRLPAASVAALTIKLA